MWARTVAGRIGRDETAREVGLALRAFYQTVPEEKINQIRQALVAHAGEALAGGSAAGSFGGVVSYSTSSTGTGALSFRIGSPDRSVELFDEEVLAATETLERTVTAALDAAILAECE